MDFGFTKEDDAFRQEVKQWLLDNIPSEWREGSPRFWEHTDETWVTAREFERKLAKKGWWVPSFPLAYGGIGATHIQQLIINEEKAYLGAPMTANDANSSYVGTTILRYGSDEQKNSYVTGLGKSEILFCTGYSEPGAGSDLASIQTRAIETEDHFIINGQKTFTSRAHRADYCWLATRTDPDVPKHKGISLFIVDMKSPGITVQPLINIVGAHDFNEVFFDNVRVSKQNLVGEKNQGWLYLTTALNYERSGILLPATAKLVIEQITKYARETQSNGRMLSDDPIFQQRLAGMATKYHVCRLLCYHVAWLQQRGHTPSYEASISYLFGCELIRHVAKTGMEILGSYSLLTRNSKWMPLGGIVEHLYLSSLAFGIGGGTMEIQRNLIALLGLGLHRS